MGIIKKLIRKYGIEGKLKGEWRFAVCLAVNKETCFETVIPSARTFVAIPSGVRKEGYPLDSMQINNEGKYLAEISPEEREKTVANEMPKIRMFIEEIIR